MDKPAASHNNAQGPNLEAFQNAYNAGRGQGNFWYTEGRASAKVVDNTAFVEAGNGSDRAIAVVAPRTELVYVDREVGVPTTKPLHKSKRTCCIVLLIIVILLIVAAIAIGVGVHEANKSSGYGY